MKNKVYLAASAADMDRAKVWRQRLRAAGVDVLASWIDNVELVGSSNPRDATKKQRLQWVSSDLKEMTSAHVVWMLVPDPSKPTRGAWFEAGVAYYGAQALVFSGDTKQSIYSATGIEFDSDEDAFRSVLGMLDLDAKEAS